METIEANWYDYPRLYDLAFSWDPTVEVDFLTAAFERFGDGPTQRVFEPFCGTGRLVIPLAQGGLHISGLDINCAAIEFARQRCQAEGIMAGLAVGDVTTWSPPHPVDAIITLIDSFRHLTTAEAAAGAMRAFHAGLRPGGLLIIGLDLGEPAIEVSEHNCWEMHRAGLTVETFVSSLRKPGPTPGTTLTRAVLHVTEPDGREYQIITDEEMRDYTLDSLKHLAAEHGPFEPLATFEFEDLSIDNPTDARDPNGNTVVVFRRESEDETSDR